MKNQKTAAAQQPEALLNELRTLVLETEQMLAGVAEEDGEEAMATLRARFAATQERVSGACTSARRQIKAGATATDEKIRANPYPSIAIALGAGLLIGVLAGRRRE